MEIARSSSSLTDFSNVSIDGMGNVAFTGHDAEGTAAIFLGDGSTLRTLEQPPADDIVAVGNSLMNDAGQLAFVATDASLRNRLFVLDNGQLSVLAEDLVDGITTVQSPYAFNEAGMVLFAAGYDFGNGDSGFRAFTSELARPNPHPTGPDFPQAIDDNGTLAVNSSAGLAVVAPDGAVRTILERGDALFGSKVKALTLSSQGLQGRGQLAFLVDLEDTRRAIIHVCLTTPY